MNIRQTDQPVPGPVDPSVPVLIVGGGVVGLSAALFLLHQGIRPLLIERHRGTSIHPRARGFDIRTMELYREIGLSEVIREAGKALAPAWGIHTSDSMAAALRKKKPGKKKSPEKMPGMGDLAALSPETGARCTQDLSEPILLAAARERGAEIQFYTELISFTQDEQGVTASILDRDSGEERVLRAGYLIAADGARSSVRETLQAPTTGRGAISDLLNIYFEADLGDFVRGREFSIILIRKPSLKGMLASINNSDRWVFHLYYDTARGEKAADFTTERVAGILQEVVGIPGTAIRVISILPWQPTVKVVNEMQHGRVFLAGDAAHVMTPYGGKGANTGIQDVHNLAWKLAAVIKGEAHPVLLHTYNAERQPVGLFNALRSGEWADSYGLLTKKFSVILGLVGSILFARLTRMLRSRKLNFRPGLHGIGGIMGLPDYKYRSGAVADNEPPAAGYEPSIRSDEPPAGKYIKTTTLDAAPGTRVPHLWVEYRHQRTSTLDLAGSGWVLFTGPENEAWKKAAAQLDGRSGITIPVYSIGPSAELVYNERMVPGIFGIGDHGAILIRPDGFVAWRSKEAVDQPALVLEKVVSRLSGFSFQSCGGGFIYKPM